MDTRRTRFVNKYSVETKKEKLLDTFFQYSNVQNTNSWNLTTPWLNFIARASQTYSHKPKKSTIRMEFKSVLMETKLSELIDLRGIDYFQQKISLWNSVRFKTPVVKRVNDERELGKIKFSSRLLFTLSLTLPQLVLRTFFFFSVNMNWRARERGRLGNCRQLK